MNRDLLLIAGSNEAVPRGYTKAVLVLGSDGYAIPLIGFSDGTGQVKEVLGKLSPVLGYHDLIVNWAGEVITSRAFYYQEKYYDNKTSVQDSRSLAAVWNKMIGQSVVVYLKNP